MVYLYGIKSVEIQDDKCRVTGIVNMDTNKRKVTKHIDGQVASEIFLKKHVGLIHCENKLTLIQRKICNILLFNALDKINNEDIHQISLRQLCSLVGYNSNDSQLIKKAIKSLISIVMEWNLLDDNKFLNEENYPEEMISWNASSLLAGASIKNGIIGYSYSPQMKSVLSSLDIYGRINLFVQAKFTSSYSLVLYENCVRFKNIKKTSWFSMELFRALMGVASNKYTSFKEFKRNVINVAVKEVNQKSDIFIEPQFKKSGRKITSIQFSLYENENYHPTFRKIQRVRSETSIHQKQAALLELIVSDFSLSSKQANDIVTKHPYDYVVEKVNLIRSKKSIDHPGAYLISALKRDYRPKKEKMQKNNKIIEKTYLREAKKASEITPLKNKYMSYKLKAYMTFMQQQADQIQQAIKEKFEQFLNKKSEIFRFYKKSGFSSPFVMADFIIFIDKNFSHIIGDYLTFDDYITSEEV